jgi:hypothetical protein
MKTKENQESHRAGQQTGRASTMRLYKVPNKTVLKITLCHALNAAKKPLRLFFCFVLCLLILSTHCCMDEEGGKKMNEISF